MDALDLKTAAMLVSAAATVVSAAVAILALWNVWRRE